MRFFVLVFLFFACSLYANSIDKKIKSTNTKLSQYSRSYSSLNKKMANIAKAILDQKRALVKQEKYLKKLQEELSMKELKYKDNIYQLKLMKKSQDDLLTKQKIIEDKLVFVIAKSVSLSVILDEEFTPNEESLMEFEVLKAMLKKEKDKAKILNEQFMKNSNDMDSLNKHASRLKVVISNIDVKRKKLLKTKAEKKKALAKLTEDKKAYKKKVQTLLKRQNQLKNTLAKLNIIKIDEIKRAKEEKERQRAFANKKIHLDKNRLKVKKHGSSYQAQKTKRYRGSKTIAPLDNYTITKKYGTYTDPIYGIKIFNESISMKSKYPNAKVKTVFNGKVIYAAKTAVLKNIVIVEHKNGLHTIYANLSQISPNTKKGKKIKKGYTIGRVKDELIFEVTQKSYHINPIRLLR